MSRLLFTVLALSLPAVALAQVDKPKSPTVKRQDCAAPTTTLVDGKGQRAGIHKLGDMPPAKQYLTVLREVDGCPQPVVLREGIGKRR